MIYPVSNSLYSRSSYTRLNNNPVEKSVSATVTKDLFEKSDEPQKEVAFNGALGATVGAVTGEIAALWVTKILTAPEGVFWPLAIVTVATGGLGLLGSFIEDKIDLAREVKELQNQNSDEQIPPKD